MSMDYKAYQAAITGNIETYGRFLQAVGGSDDVDGFVYSIGNLYIDAPDILIVGGMLIQSGQVINIICDKHLDALRAAKDGDLFDIGGKFPLKVAYGGAKTKAEYTVQAGQFYGTEDYKVVQLIIPDRDGRYPGHPFCAHPFHKWGRIG